MNVASVVVFDFKPRFLMGIMQSSFFLVQFFWIHMTIVDCNTKNLEYVSIIISFALSKSWHILFTMCAALVVDYFVPRKVLVERRCEREARRNR